jgi:glycosyltransferase 2 family protein
MSSKLKNTIKLATSIAIMVFFLYVSFRGTDFPKLMQILAGANYWWVLAMLPILVVSHLLRTWRWAYLLRPIKKNLRFRNLFSALIVGYMMNNLLPKVGELVRPYAVGKLEGVSRSAAFGTVLVERIFDVLSLMAVIILIPLVYSGPLTEQLPWLEETGIWLTVCTLAVFGFFVFLMFRRDIVVRILRSITGWLSPRRAQLVERITHSFLDGFLFLKQPRHYFPIALLSVLIWGLYIVMMLAPFYAFNMTEDYGLGWGAAMVVQGISSIGIVIPTPASAGPYHYFTIQTLTKLYAVDEEVARSYATVTNAVGAIGITLIGFFYFLKDRLHMGEVLKEDRVETPPVPGG